MQELLVQKGVDHTIVELLEAAGYIEVNAFLSTDAKQVHAELEKANSMLSIVDNVPTVHQIVSLQDAVSEPFSEPASAVERVTTGEPSAASIERPQSIEAEAEVSAMAIPLAADYISAHKIDVSSLPSALPAEAKQAHREKPAVEEVRPAMGAGTAMRQNVQTQAPVKRDVDKSRVKSLDEFRVSGSAVAPLERREDDSHLRGAKKETNAGVDPSSEKFIRGVLHNDASRTFWGAAAYFVALFFFLLSFLPVVYIVFEKEHFVWGLLAPGLFLIALLTYVLGARKSSCPVCRQRQFVPKACNKHVKAHKSPGLGYMIPTAWHLLRYKWFRCIFCGTSIRVKE